MDRQDNPVLLVDDDESVLASLRLLLKQAGFSSVSASGPDEALARLSERPFSLVVQDMNFSRDTSGVEGIDLLQRIQEVSPQIPVVLLTAWGSIELAVRGIKAGARDFITKPWNNAHLLQILRTAMRLSKSPAQADLDRESLDEAFDFSAIIGQHPSLVGLLNTVARVARTDAPVLILGESGTGKELIADALHQNSARQTGALIKVNLGGIPTQLFESEMFGHVRGAFTDARTDREGRFETADGGTIFLDEVADLDRSCQVKLLRVLQDRTFQPVGSSKNRSVDVRVVSATNRDLDAMVADDAFREDLLYRLNLITLRIPPLRERRSDIPLIAQHHLGQVSQAYKTDEISLEPAAVEWLKTRDWPGNVRQLRQTLERAVLMSGKQQLNVEDLADLTPTDPGRVDPFADMTLDEMERLMIQNTLLRADGNVSRAADALGISRPALYRRMEKHGL